MKDHDFHAKEAAEYPWRVDIPIAGDFPFSATTADLNLDDAKEQGEILLKRFGATTATLTPIVVSRGKSPQEIDTEIRQLTTVLTANADKKESSMLNYYKYQKLPELKRINIFVGSDDFLSQDKFISQINKHKKLGAESLLRGQRLEKLLTPIEQIERINAIVGDRKQYIIATHSNTILEALNLHLEVGLLVRGFEQEEIPSELKAIAPLFQEDLAIYELYHKNKIIQFKNLLDPKTGLISPDAFLADQMLRDRRNLINSICPK